jgi:hypothetical protein
MSTETEEVVALRAKLESCGIVTAIATCIGEVEAPLRERQAQLRRAADDADGDVRRELERAVSALEAAAVAASVPVRRRLGAALIEIARLHGLPVSLESAPSSRRNRRSGGEAGAPVHEERVVELARRSGSGMTTGQVAAELGVSAKVARRLCEGLVRCGRMRHNGRPRQESRYLAV